MMKKILIALLFFVFSTDVVYSQTEYVEINSLKELDDDFEIIESDRPIYLVKDLGELLSLDKEYLQKLSTNQLRAKVSISDVLEGYMTIYDKDSISPADDLVEKIGEGFTGTRYKVYDTMLSNIPTHYFYSIENPLKNRRILLIEFVSEQYMLTFEIVE